MRLPVKDSRLRWRWRWTLPLALLAVAAALGLRTHRLESQIRSPLPLPAAPRFEPSLAFRPAPGEAVPDLDRAVVPHPFSIRSRQTLGGLLMELGLEPSDAYAAAATLADYVDMRKIRAGQSGMAYFEPGGGLAGVRLEIFGRGRARLARAGAAWTASWSEYSRETRTRRVAGELRSFLEHDLAAAGGRPQAAYAMAEVLQWDLDFNRDLRLGDRFRVLYDEVLLDGEFHELGAVQALIYENRGRRLAAYRYGDGYYDAEGRPVQKMFLRSPLRFTRVTSRFSHRRFHPVLKVHRPHYGVDYGAPKGTPVRVTASGVVIFAGRSGDAGKMVKVRHPNGYVTAYLHLSGYASGIGKGKRVAQGDTVGYVGSTGLATASHLDYRVQKDGRWVDPLRLESKPAPPIPPAEMADYAAERDRLRAALDGVRHAAERQIAEGPPTSKVRAGAAPGVS